MVGFRNLSLRWKLLIPSGIFVVALVAYAVLAHFGLEHVKVNGPLYDQIEQTKDLIADIHSPAENLVGTYLLVHQIALEHDAPDLKELIEEFHQLRDGPDGYMAKHKYWSDSLPDGSVKQLLLDKSYPPAVAFFNDYDHSFLPAIEKGDYAGAQKVMDDLLTPSYRKHHAAIEELTKALATQNDQIEATAEQSVGRNVLVLTVLAVVFVIGGGATAFFISRLTSRPILQTVSVLEAVAGGDYERRMDVKSTDELGRMASALNSTVGAIKRAIGTANDAVANSTSISTLLAELAKAQDVGQAVRTALDVMSRSFGFAYGSFWKLDATANVLKLDTEVGTINAEFSRTASASTYREGDGLTGRAWKSRDLVFVPEVADVKDCPRMPVAERAGVHSGLCFPLVVEGKVVGVVDFFANETLAPTAERMEAFRSVGRLLSGAVERIQKARQEQEQAADLRAKVDTMLSVVNAAAKGDLTQTITVTGPDAIGQLGDGLAKFFSDLRKSVSTIVTNATSLAASREELTQVSESMSANAEETSTQVSVVSAAAEEVSRSVSTVATASEEMAASIKEISKNATDAARVATGAVTLATDTTAIITKLGESSQEIGNVIKLITGIAQQTNLLALNATIEAARAGEAGKGFAVVANEVKELAKETARATEEISHKIEAIRSDTDQSIDAIAKISATINEINNISSTIASAVEEQTATTNEMTRNISEAAKGSNDIAQNIVGIAAAAKSTTAGANNTSQAAVSLSKMSTELQEAVGTFKV